MSSSRSTTPVAPGCNLWVSSVAADRGPRFRLLGDSAAYVKWGMDTQEAKLSGGRSPAEPDWGEEPRDSWGHTIAGTDRRAGTPPWPGHISSSTPGWRRCFSTGLLRPSTSRMPSSRPK